MYEVEPCEFLPPLIVVLVVEASSIGIEYLEEHLIGETIDRQVWRRFRVLAGTLTCGK